MVAKEQKILDEEEEADLAITQNTRRIVNGCYDNIEHVQPDACTHLLQVSISFVSWSRAQYNGIDNTRRTIANTVEPI